MTASTHPVSHWNVLPSRRKFLGGSAGVMALSATGYFSSVSPASSQSPNEKLNLAAVGVAHRGAANIRGVRHENIVALCDVDANYLAKAAGEFPKAKQFADFRKMYDQIGNQIDGVLVSTPDHTHASVTVAGMKLGKHVYCEKPLTHDLYQARLCRETAAKMKVATQMGTQIHAGENYRRVVELVRSGIIGTISQVHVWVSGRWGGGNRPQEGQPVPPHLNWDLWLGPASQRPFYPEIYHPINWRRWWAFGGGTLADMACHYCDLPFWALRLRFPTTIEAIGAEVHSETCPVGVKVIYEFAQRDDRPALRLTWYDGDMVPKTIAGLKRPAGAGVFFVGQKGTLFANYTSHKLFPQGKFADFQPPPKTIPKSVGHHQEWLNACKTGSPTTCNFDYAGPLTEAVLLGTVAYRTGQKLQWDAENLKATNCREADGYIRQPSRRGWTL